MHGLSAKAIGGDGASSDATRSKTIEVRPDKLQRLNDYRAQEVAIKVAILRAQSSQSTLGTRERYRGHFAEYPARDRQLEKRI